MNKYKHADFDILVNLLMINEGILLCIITQVFRHNYCHSYYNSFEILSDWRQQNYRMQKLVIVIPLQLM